MCLVCIHTHLRVYTCYTCYTHSTSGTFCQVSYRVRVYVWVSRVFGRVYPRLCGVSGTTIPTLPKTKYTFIDRFANLYTFREWCYIWPKWGCSMGWVNVYMCEPQFTNAGLRENLASVNSICSQKVHETHVLPVYCDILRKVSTLSFFLLNSLDFWGWICYNIYTELKLNSVRESAGTCKR